MVFIAVPYGAYPQIGKDYGSLLAGKIVLDAGNATARRDGDDITNEAKEEGIGTVSAKYLPGARIVRAFNSHGLQVLCLGSQPVRRTHGHSAGGRRQGSAGDRLDACA